MDQVSNMIFIFFIIVSKTCRLHTAHFYNASSKVLAAARVDACGLVLWDIFSKWESGVSDNKTWLPSGPFHSQAAILYPRL